MLFGVFLNCFIFYSDNDIRVWCEKFFIRVVECGFCFCYVFRGFIENRVDYYRKYEGNCDLDVLL